MRIIAYYQGKTMENPSSLDLAHVCDDCDIASYLPTASVSRRENT